MKSQFTITSIIICILTNFGGYAQSGNNGCDTVYDLVETLPQYPGEIDGLMNYLNDELVPVISNCIERDSILTSSLRIILSVNTEGSVFAVDLTRVNATDECKRELREKILTMRGWTAGQKDGKPVCSQFHWPISCLKWE